MEAEAALIGGRGQWADCTDPEVLRQLGVHEFTSAVVGIGTDIEASALVTSNLLDEGVPSIWAKAISRQRGQILERLGAHHASSTTTTLSSRRSHPTSSPARPLL
ncbi:NAD-binding protein [Streptomyces sp900116325]|uniref:NAD-binding protein n=1 Tax=Streptomyces sp. 900116325 TaxID=3154295 RepID=UPI0033C1AE10